MVVVGSRQCVVARAQPARWFEIAARAAVEVVCLLLTTYCSPPTTYYSPLSAT